MHQYARSQDDFWKEYYESGADDLDFDDDDTKEEDQYAFMDKTKNKMCRLLGNNYTNNVNDIFDTYSSGSFYAQEMSRHMKYETERVTEI